MDIAEQVGISKATAYRYLSYMESLYVPIEREDVATKHGRKIRCGLQVGKADRTGGPAL